MINTISKLARIGKNVRLGNNNIIGDNVVISDNVIIGSNNKIFSNNIIYQNVEIGDNNVILEGNIIGEHPVNMEEFNGKIYKGVTIGNNNYFHCRSVIFGGSINKTYIGNNNKISYNTNISHDVSITNNVHLYPNVIVGGHSVLLPYSGIGIGGGIHQNRVLGSYSFIGMLSASTKNAFPYFIYAGNKCLRVNTKRVPEYIHKYDEYLRYIVDNYINMTSDDITQNCLIFPNEIKQDISLFLNNIKL
jgi:acyl-[acyl carrier protein]--UDP-N-acetylglucosamine O-acyltransferase